MGFGIQKKEKSQGGKVVGKGTGTSDDIKKTVPAGTYIMPTDSTQQIGEQNLQQMGTPTDVNVSNGEFEMTPEQVHQVGVQTLDQMKAQTHAPVDQPQVQGGFGLKKPQLFFANGGLVSPYPSADEVRKAQLARSQSLPSTNVNPSAQSTPGMRTISGVTGNVPNPALPNSANAARAAATAPTAAAQGSRLANFGKGLGILHGVSSMAGGAYEGYGTSTDDYATRLGLDPNKERGVLADTAIRTAGVMSDIGNAASFGLLGKRFGDKQVNQAQADYEAQQARFAAWNRQKEATNPKAAAPTTQPTIQDEINKAMYGEQAQPSPSVGTQTAANNPYAIQQKGNSFSYQNPSAAAQARAAGVPELQTEGVVGGIRRANDPKGVDNFMANTREMGPTQAQINQAVAQMRNPQGVVQYPDRPQRTDEQNAERRQLIDDIRAPIKGARGMTSNQRAQLLELQTGDDNRATQMYNTDAGNATSQLNNASNNAANIAQTMMREQGATDRNLVGEYGQNYRQGQALEQDSAKFNADFGLKKRQQDLTETKEGFGIRNAQRLEKLNEMYDNAKTDEQRQSIQERIGRLTGSKENGRDRYMTVGGGQEWSEQAGGMVNRPQQIFDTQTQQYVDSAAQSPASQPSQNHISALRNNPQQAAQFDAIYGQGAAAQYLKQ